MTLACIEHINVTVESPDRVAQLFCNLFDWRVRWAGESKDNGYSVHVGSDKRYIALYTHPNSSNHEHSYLTHGTVNHIGVIVKDLNSMEQRVQEHGLKPDNHRDYDVCRSFYFMAEKCLEIEVVSYPK